MKNALPPRMLIILAVFCCSTRATSQDQGLEKIDIPDLQTHMSVLAADDMEGRATGEPGLVRAAEYIVSQAKRTGLKPVDENNDYTQEYTLVKKTMDTGQSYIRVSAGNQINLPFYVINQDSGSFDIRGEAVFAGYGIRSEEDGYDDFEGVDLSGKVVLIMNRGPMDEAGRENLLTNNNWKDLRTFRDKMTNLAVRQPKAVLIVPDPKSGHHSLEEQSRGMARYLLSSKYVKELGRPSYGSRPDIPMKIIFIHRDVAEEILKPRGLTLEQLQDSIDAGPEPLSFELPGTEVDLHAVYHLVEKKVPNIAGLVEGRHPKLRDEVIIYMAHFDHLGMNLGGAVYNGADDNASGTVALIELAEAFVAEQKNLKRSVMMLWVSGEEIGLYGSKFYVQQPLLPLEETVTALNLDMVGAVRTDRDRGSIHGEKVSVLGMDTIGLIGGLQSSDLMDIHNKTAESIGLKTDNSLNDPHHPYRYFYRSDHFSFARNDVPVLFYSTGVHVDYHKVTDDYERINFTKLKKVTELSFLVGYQLATQRKRIEVDHPFSAW
jgi:hypothetical protein